MKKILVILTVIASFVLCSCEPPTVNVPNSIDGGNKEPSINNVYNIEIVVKNESGEDYIETRTNKDSDYLPKTVEIFEKDENGVIINDEVTVYKPKSDYKKIICKNYTKNTRIEVEYDISYKFVPCEKKLNDIVNYFEKTPVYKICDKKADTGCNKYIIDVSYITTDENGREKEGVLKDDDKNASIDYFKECGYDKSNAIVYLNSNYTTFEIYK